MRNFFRLNLFILCEALRKGCDPSDIFLHTKIPSSQRQTFKQPFFDVDSGVWLDQRGTSAKWTKPCCHQRDPNNNAKCADHSAARGEPSETRRIYCR